MAVCIACLGGGCSAFVCVAVCAAMVGLVGCNYWRACVVSKICCSLVGAGRLRGHGVWSVADRAGFGCSMACGGGIG